MIPRTLSASSLQVANLCMDRWVAEYLNRAPGFSNAAADVGSSVHGGLEEYVRAVYMDKSRHPSLDLLITYYNASYMKIFGTADIETDEYQDGLELVKKWFKRTSFEGRTVESLELKETIKIPYNHPDTGLQELDFNYIMDRLDRTGETTWEVVDYKTVRVPIQPEDLDTKVQARAYALAVQIKHPEATQIKVTFDLLRHDPVSIIITRDDNVRFWRYLCNETQRIVDTREDDVHPTLNMECGYCVKKFSCPLVKKNIAAGGIYALDASQAAQMKLDLEAQAKAAKLIVAQLEEMLLVYAANEDVLEWDTEDGVNTVEVTSYRRRTFDASKAAEIVGPELFAKVGSMTLSELDRLIKDESLSEEQRKNLKALVSYRTGDLKAKVKPKTKVI